MAKGNERLRIYSLGRFAIYIGDKPIHEAEVSMSKKWRLFKYLLTHRKTAIPGEFIGEIFWPRASRPKALHSLRNTIYLLRLALDSADLAGESNSLFVIRHGMVSLNRHADFWFDAAEFESLCAQAHASIASEKAAAVELFQQALELYKGDYLSEALYDDWVKGARSSYRQIYRRAVMAYSQLLMDGGDYAEARRICERLLEFSSLDEEVQSRVMESLIGEGEMEKARALYGRFSSFLYHESGSLPSRRMRTLYQKVQKDAGRLTTTDFDTIKELLVEQDDSTGALFCDEDWFQRMFTLERQRVARTGIPAQLLKMNLVNRDLSLPSVKETDRSAAVLQGFLDQMLRHGDVACRSTDTQFLLILPGVATTDVVKVTKRIEDRFKKSYSGPVMLRIRAAPL